MLLSLLKSLKHLKKNHKKERVFLEIEILKILFLVENTLYYQKIEPSIQEKAFYISLSKK